MKINWPSAQEISIVDDIRSAIGRDVIFDVTVSSIACYNCHLDPVTDLSTNSFCPICSGEFWIPQVSGYVISGHITWAPINNFQWESGGQYFDGDCLVQIKYTSENDLAANKAHVVWVDGKEMLIKNIIYRGVKDINRILVNLIERE